ncbi:hypothetical protein A2210_02890 [Candidatus Woesebacteria bacterium RIFOXYA1_FULL_40_18]|uniref:Uncharacterized protein n=3 Tax=Candidatus Woeseibacteriota TaxID=1752722 RepID=A0A1F8CID7_9BACT|nr:MAG: hypothetical protein A2210_02890 [Candidatus Woesebacteria bacterium RIFOXYA1_FULL_40_18]OGM80306.1 MAG: hypothetical protein A2361_01755 [Candidatus Woesebacteria bacterium RIFOXYB1_FULL_40_26]OGM87171.1 MAG: hypothetical protein A2614_01870 [Candidatus Woesebacteria bacterium RIFOXYD1_FULL_40_21]
MVEAIANFIQNPVVINSIGALLFINILLKLFYKSFELTWPELYFATNDKTALFVSVSFRRFLMFRFLPPFVLIIFGLSVFLRDFGFRANLYVSLISISVYLINHDVKAIYQILTKSDKVKTYFNLWFQIILHLFVVVLMLVLGVVSAYIVSSNLFSITKILPTFQGLADNLWSSLIAVLLAVYFKEIFSHEGLSQDILYRRSLETIPPKLLNLIESESKKHNADENLVKAVCVAENLQRPKWVRKIENIKAFLRLYGTYGIMQVRSNKPISDEESIKVAIRERFKNSASVFDPDQRRKIVSDYNKDSRYIDVVFNILSYLGDFQTPE